MYYLLSSGVVLAVLYSAPKLRSQSGPAPTVISANSSADYAITIAQGSLFVIFGYQMGPDTLVQVSAFPLPNTLAGTSVTVTSGSTTLNCPMIYTSDSQVAAVLPSNTPAGVAVITVTYNGQSIPQISTAKAIVATNSTGLYTTTSSGLGTGIFTAIDGTLNTNAASAKPGDIVTAWATGMGPIGTPDNVLPTSFPNFPNVQVWVGSQSAQVIYAGRSGCCAGVDQIAFTVPAVTSGCNVPVTIVSGLSSSNSVTIPVNPAGGTCVDPAPTLPAPLLTKAAAGQPVRVAAIAVGPLSGLVPAFGELAAVSAKALAENLSTVLRIPVSSEDVEKLTRAFAANKPKAIRAAMAKYASRWKTLDAKTKNALTVQLTGQQERAAAMFANYSSPGVLATVAGAQIPPPGSCVILPSRLPHGLGSPGRSLDAGASLTLVGAPGRFTLNQQFRGFYYVSLGPSVTGASIPSGAYTVSGSGGTDVGAFSATVNIPAHTAIANKSALATVNRTQGVTVAWTGGVTGNYVLLGGNTPGGSVAGVPTPGVYFACTEDAGKNTFTIPGYILSSLNAANGTIWLASSPLSNQITIPGIDFAYFVDASVDSVSATFR